MPVPLPFLLTPALLIAPAPAAEWRFHAEDVLGTRLDIFASCASPFVARCAADAAMAEIRRLDALLSRHNPASELSLLNASQGMAVSPELFDVLARAAHWREVSDGAFDERLGAASLLARAGDAEGARAAAAAARTADIRLDPETRIVRREHGAVIDLDAIAKGYVIDRALAAMRRAAPDLSAGLVSIGGDMAGWRADPGAWRIGLPVADVAADNAPLAAVVDIREGAVATSGRGMRDIVVDGARVGPAFSASEGNANEKQLCATAQAACAMDADALATIALLLAPEKAMAIADATPGAALRIVGPDGGVSRSARWQERPAQLVQVRQTSPKPPSQPGAPSAPAADKWPVDWRMAIWYKLPERRKRDPEFREPYMAVWITDKAGKAVRTLFMVGQNAKWQKDNFVWWGSYRARTKDIKAEDIIDARSEATAPTGRYAFMWEGKDDADRRVPAGAYTIHIETSRERGRHTYRTMDFVIGQKKFEQTMDPSPEEGGFTAVFGHYNDLLDYSPD
jgi:FAD:protein FMN transferase